MTLILACFNQKYLVGITDSAIVDCTKDNKRVKSDAKKIFCIPYLNGYVSYYGDAEIGGSTELVISKLVQQFKNSSCLYDFSEAFGKFLNAHYSNCDRSGFHIAGFNEEGNFCFYHWSNEDPENVEISQNKFSLVSPNQEQLKREYSNPRYVYFFFNGDYKIFQTIFVNYTVALEELRKIMPNKNSELESEQIKNIGESLLKLIASTSEMFGYWHIGGKISFEVIHNKIVNETRPKKDPNFKTSLPVNNHYSNFESSLFKAGSFAQK